MAKSASKPLNVFIGCPGDMALERDALLASREHIRKVVCPVEFTTWKLSASGVGDAQRVIFENDPVESFDIVVILLWSRLGESSGIFDPLTKAEMTGTEAEFVAAYDLHKASGKQRPQVLLYRCERKVEIDTNSPKLGEQMAQLQSVQQFFERTKKGALRPMLAPGFKTAEELKEFVTRDIGTAADRLRAAKKPAAPASPKNKTPKASAPAPDSRELLHRYFANLRDQFAIYENLGLPVPERDGKEGEKDKPVPIRDLFVAPACTEAQFRPEAFDAALREGKNPATPLLPRLAPAKSRTVLLADPGMGKSTLIQWLISTLADEAVPPGAQELRGAIPLPFILRDLVTHLPQDVKGWNCDALVDAFRQWRHRGKGAPLAAPLMADDALFRSILASPGAFFLIDGLDEIGDPQRRLAIRDAIWEGFEKYPNARWLITSRIVGYEEAPVDRMWVRADTDSPPRNGSLFLGHEKFDPSRVPPFIDSVVDLDNQVKVEDGRTDRPYRRHDLMTMASRLHLTPFDDTQQFAFARNWYVPRLGDAAGTQRADDFIAAVHRNDHTRVISRVPNLLYLLALLFRHRARLPDGRALVYDAISTAYLAGIDLDKRLPDSFVVPWKKEQKEDLLALVAMRMQEIRVAQSKDVEDVEDFEDFEDFEQREDVADYEDREDGGNATGVKDSRPEILVARGQLEEWLAPRFGDAGDPEACAELHRFLDHIANRSGLLLPRGEGVFGFAHLSFQEYYAACYLEKEFQRILTEKSQSSGDDIFGPPSTVAKKDEEKMFAEMAAQPAWHEPLLFLVEKLRHSAPYTRTILAWSFPQLATEPEIENEDDAYGAIEEWLPFTAAQLLAGISLDQEVTLDDAQRSKIWRSLWLADIAAVSENWNIGPSLLVAGSPYHAPVLSAAASLLPEKFYLYRCTAVSDLKPLSGFDFLNTLILSGCTEVSDLMPLAGLTSLNYLNLTGCTEVSDLMPLAGLNSLSELNLSCCTEVSDLMPLAGLDSLTTLNLSDCTEVSDLKPLVGLASLNTLWLNDCTEVSDLKPLAGLASLKTLSLHGCTAVSDEAVAALQASLPKLKIHR